MAITSQVSRQPMLYFILCVLLVSGVVTLRAQSNFRVAGTIHGAENGTLAFVESLAEQNYVEVPFKKGHFTFEGAVSDFIFYNVALLDDAKSNSIRLCPFILEPGETEIEITISPGRPSILETKFVKTGEMNGQLLKYISIEKYFSIRYKEAREKTFSNRAVQRVSDARTDSLNQLLKRNYSNVLGLLLGYSQPQFYPANKIKALLDSLPISLRKTKYYKHLYSRVKGKNENTVGEIISDFCLDDQDGKQVCLSEVISGRNYVLLDFWGSWCGQCKIASRQIIPIYEKYKDARFEVCGIALESRKENWLRAITTEGYNWTNLLEMESDIEGNVCISKYLNPDRLVPFNILLNHERKIIAKNVSAMELDEILSKRNIN